MRNAGVVFILGLMVACGPTPRAGDDTAGGDDTTECTPTCSADSHAVLDCKGEVLTECEGTQACDPTSFTCQNACVAAENNGKSVGCDYYATDMDVQQPEYCFATFVANTWTSPAKISVKHRGQTLNAASFVVREVALERNRDLVGRTLGDIAADRGTSPAELLIDLSVEEDLDTWFVRVGVGHHDPAAVGSILRHPYVHVGASDGGAHVGSFATYGDTGLLLGRFVRDTGAMRLEEAIKKITSDTCAIWGLRNRGVLAEGFAADVAIFDPTTIDRGPEIASDDFPGDGIRWIRRQVGMDTVIVNGAVTWTAAQGYIAGARAGTIATL